MDNQDERDGIKDADIKLKSRIREMILKRLIGSNDAYLISSVEFIVNDIMKLFKQQNNE